VKPADDHVTVLARQPEGVGQHCELASPCAGGCRTASVTSAMNAAHDSKTSFLSSTKTLQVSRRRYSNRMARGRRRRLIGQADAGMRSRRPNRQLLDEQPEHGAEPGGILQ